MGTLLIFMIPGALISTATVLVNPTITALPPSSTTTTQSTSTSPSSSVIVVTSVPPPAAPSSSASPTLSLTTSSTSSLISSATLSCYSGFRSCPSSLGGGCCHTDLACGPSSCPTSSGGSSSSTSTGANLGIPIRPTSNAATSTSTSLSVGDACPTGFYQCSAFYHGGCCRVGRDCNLTSCPASASTTVANTNGVVIVAPTGSGIGSGGMPLGTGSCAQGWLTCAADNGGGCCPSGYVCGQSCTATATGAGATTPSIAGKIATGAAIRLGKRKWGAAVSSMLGTCMGLIIGMNI